MKMSKKLLLSTAAAALVGLALSASTASATVASVTGTVDVTGVVTSKCVVITEGGTSSVFGGTIALGELDQADGTLDTALSGSDAGAPARGIVLDFHVVCNSATPTVSVDATRLSDGVVAGAGQSSDIDYTAETDVDLAAGTTTAVTYVVGPGSPGSPAATSTILSGPIKNAANNVRVEVYALNTEGGASKILTAGSYSSTITIVITPT
jgi:hypothetical protein